MAKEARYNIVARDRSRKGISSANKNIETLGKTASKVSKMAVARFAAVGLSIAGITKTINAAVKAFGIQEQAEIRMAAAARNNPLIDGTAVASLNEYAAALQRASNFGDEMIIGQQAFLTTMGMSEDQIKKVMQAAVDLSSTGMFSLESAVKNLAKTYSGLSGELGEAIPALRELTAEQLKAGAGVEAIAEMYAGMGEAVSKGVSGQLTQLKNMWDDTLEGLGEGLAPIILSISKKLKPIFEKLIEWFNTYKNQITNFFINFPAIAGAAFQFAKDILAKSFSPEFLMTLGGALWEFFMVSAKAAIETVWAFIKAIGTTIWEPLKVGFEYVVFGIRTGLNKIIGFLNLILEKAHDTMEALNIFKKEKDPFTGGMKLLTTTAPKGVDAKAIAGAWSKALKTSGEQVKVITKGLVEAGKTIGAEFGDEFQQFRVALGEILNKDIPDSLKSPIVKLLDAVDNASDTFSKVVPDPYKMGEPGLGAGAGIEMPTITLFQPLMDAISHVSSELFSVEKEETHGGMIEKLVLSFSSLGDIIMSAGTQFISMFAAISSISQILNPVKTILQNMFKVLAPVVNTVLAPIINVLRIMGETIGKILIPATAMLAPILQLVGLAFMWLYNWAIKPLGNAIIFIVVALNNAIAWVINGIIKLINKLPFVNIKWRMATMDYDKMKLQSASTSDLTSAEESAAGTAASYTGGNTYNVNVVINTDVISGEGGFRDLSIMIRDEISAVEALGV
ncbi:hypothetical protein DRQ25_08920 [Candidatus Fermentibacteria bacterium]|nr:MAG: hypothetical protein DRQ25_08920 [Candidatus Fermentibacteria bacterium]